MSPNKSFQTKPSEFKVCVIVKSKKGRLPKYNLGSSDKLVTTSGSSLYFQTNFSTLPKQIPNTNGGEKSAHANIIHNSNISIKFGEIFCRLPSGEPNASGGINLHMQIHAPSPHVSLLGGSSTSKNKRKERERDKKIPLSILYFHINRSPV